jgi:hypothetical protein
MHRMGRRQALSALSVLAAACGGAQKGPNYDALKTPDERTAATWIAKAFRKEGFEVEGDRKVKIGNGGVLVADVAAKDDVWGVAWLRADEQQELKGKLPAPPAGVADGALWVHPGAGDDADQRVLILLEKNYQYDPDPRGKGVVRSIQEVEVTCVKDVVDFLTRAKAGQVS